MPSKKAKDTVIVDNTPDPKGRPLSVAEAEVVAETLDKFESRVAALEGVNMADLVAAEMGVSKEEASAAVKELKELRKQVRAHQALLSRPSGGGPVVARLAALEANATPSVFSPYTHLNKIENNIGRWIAKGATTILLGWLALEAVTAIIRLMGGGEQGLVIKQVFRAIRPGTVELELDLA